MTYYKLEPECEGWFGEGTVQGDIHERPPNVSKLDYEFHSWPQDDLLEALCMYIATSELVSSLKVLDPTGVTFDQVTISGTDEFKRVYGDRTLPAYEWLRVTGQAGKDDFGMSPDHCLLVSQQVLDVMQRFKLLRCTITEFQGEQAAR